MLTAFTESLSEISKLKARAAGSVRASVASARTCMWRSAPSRVVM